MLEMRFWDCSLCNQCLCDFGIMLLHSGQALHHSRIAIVRFWNWRNFCILWKLKLVITSFVHADIYNSSEWAWKCLETDHICWYCLLQWNKCASNFSLLQWDKIWQIDKLFITSVHWSWSWELKHKDYFSFLYSMGDPSTTNWSSWSPWQRDGLLSQ